MGQRTTRTAARAALLIAVIVGWVIGASPVAAAPNTALLGLQAADGDDELARRLTMHLRYAAAHVPALALYEAEVSLSQLLIAKQCEAADDACLTAIASELGVSLLLFGSISRAGEAEDFDFVVELALFDASRGVVTRELVDGIDEADTDAAGLTLYAERALERVTTREPGGSLTVLVNVADAEVSIDDRAAGVTQHGLLRLSGLSPGEHRIELKKQGYLPRLHVVEIEDGAQRSLTATMQRDPATAPPVAPAAPTASTTSAEPEPSAGLAPLGWTLFGVGAVALAGGVVSMASADDVTDGELQWLLLGGGVLGVGVGAVIIFDDSHETTDSSSSPAREPRATSSSSSSITLAPELTPRRARLNATLRF